MLNETLPDERLEKRATVSAANRRASDCELSATNPNFDALADIGGCSPPIKHEPRPTDAALFGSPHHTRAPCVTLPTARDPATPSPRKTCTSSTTCTLVETGLNMASCDWCMWNRDRMRKSAAHATPIAALRLWVPERVRPTLRRHCLCSRLQFWREGRLWMSCAGQSHRHQAEGVCCTAPPA